MTLFREAKVAFEHIEPAERSQLARLGAVLFMAGSLTAIPAGLVLDPPPKAYEHVISAFGFVAGFILWRLDWAKLPSSYLHVFPILGSLIVVAGVAAFSVVFAFFFVLAAMFVAISVQSQRVFAAYLGGLVVALLLGFAYATRELGEVGPTIFATLPVLIAVGVVSRYMHQVVEDQRDQYREFAAQAIAIGERLRGHAETRRGDSADALERRLRDLSR